MGCGRSVQCLRADSVTTKDDIMQRLAIDLRALGIPDPVQEHRFHPSRRWRFDFAWIESRVAVEIDGGTFAHSGYSRHTTGVGFRKDCEKLNAATVAGWRVLRFTYDMVRDGSALATLQDIFA